MAGAAPLKATFFAFKPRERGGVLARASLAYLGLGVLIFALFAALNWRLFPPVADWYLDTLDAVALGENGELFFRGLPPELLMLMPSYCLVIFAAAILFASYEAACLRWLIRGEVEGFFGLTLGPDTWRVWLVYWAWIVAVFVLYTLVASAVFMVVFGLGALGGGAALVAPVLFLGVYAAMIVFAVRTAPAAATTIARRRFSFFKAWAVTRGRFWPMLGSFLLLWLIGAAVIMVLCIAGLATILAASGVSFREIMSAGDREAIRAAIGAVMMTPRALTIAGAYYLLLLAFSLTLYVATFGVNARAAKAALEEGRIS